MTEKRDTAKAAERNQAAPPEEVDIVELAARIKENTRRVLFTEIKPHSFDIADYAYSFDFCNIDEQWRVYLAMKAAWAWGKETEAKGRARRGRSGGEAHQTPSDEPLNAPQ